MASATVKTVWSKSESAPAFLSREAVSVLLRVLRVMMRVWMHVRHGGRSRAQIHELRGMTRIALPHAVGRQRVERKRLFMLVKTAAIARLEKRDRWRKRG